MSSEILQMKNVNLHLQIAKKSQIQILSNVSLTIRRGEAAGLIGETGCGKTLTARSIIRLLPNSATLEGEILYDGKNIAKLDERSLLELRRKNIALIPQNPMTSLDPLFTIRQHLYETLGNEIDDSEKSRLSDEVLSKVELEPNRVLDSNPYELSGGMLQRVLIAIALIRKPKLIIADEVTTALDITTQVKVLSLIKKIRKDEDLTMLVVTHDMKVVKSLCDTISVMYVGRIVESGGANDILENPRHPYTKALMNSIPAVGRSVLEPINGIVPSFFNLPQGCKFAPRCPFVFDKCHSVDPPQYSVGKSDVACYLYSKGDNHPD